MFSPSVWTGYYKELPVEECIQKFAAAGFSHAEICFNHIDTLLQRGPADQVGAEFAAFLAGMGFSVPQGHLSFGKGLCNPEALDDLKRELEMFAAIGIQNAVLHFNGGGKLSPEERMEKRLESLRTLQGFVKGTCVTLCLENLGSVPETHTVERINSIIDTVGGEHLGICLDTGHLHMVNGQKLVTQTQTEFITGAGSRLRAMHITNNNGLNDVHQMPYSARFGIDWVEVVRAIRKIGYEGLFNLEILGECEAPEPIKTAKLTFIKTMTDYMLSEEFVQ